IADTHGPYGSYLDESFYRDSSSQQRTAEVCRRDIMRSRERHILKHVGDDALNPDMAVLPVWSAVEAFSFGTLSKVIEGMGAPRAGFAYRVKALVYLRNRCAHHSRLWHHSIIDAGPTPNNVRAKAKRAAGQFAARSVLDVVASLDDILVRAGSAPPILPELIERFASAPGFWEGLSVPRSPRDHPVA
ncbi:MAG: Abi family protein, partial [Naasia sp.]